MTKLLLVDKDNNVIGEEEKVACHLGDGLLHRAYSCFIFNKKGELLLSKRAKGKMLWPLCWENSCSSHPLKGDTCVSHAKKRLQEELGFTCPLTEKESFIYQVHYKDIGSEYENCSILIGEYNQEVQPNPEEVAEIKWISLDDLKKDIKENDSQYAPWLIIALEKL
jgi:isopentenyl-diphosphate Delta-isomerase